MTLDDIRKAIHAHPSNNAFREEGYRPVYTASPSARIAIIGQAPGRKAQETGIPWNDVSGDMLRAWLGIDRDTFYDDSRIALVPMDFYFPGKGAHGDLPPRKEFAPLWHPRIFERMPDIALTILVGQCAHRYYLPEYRRTTLTETVRAYGKHEPRYFPLVHPSPLTIRWRTKNPWFKKEVLPVLKDKVARILETT